MYVVYIDDFELHNIQGVPKKQIRTSGYQTVMTPLIKKLHMQGVSKKSRHSWETKTLGTSYPETTNL